MSITDFFIKRPVLAVVVNLLILVVGFLSYSSLTLREYPKVSNPVFEITISYSNSSADTIEQEVTTPLEEALGGLDGLDSMNSTSSYGLSSVQVKFKAGTDIASAQSDIRDRLSMSRGNLPNDINEPIVKRQEADADPFLYLSLTSDQATFPELTHIANLYLKNPLKTIDGVSNIHVIGQPYVMKIYLNVPKMLQHGLDASKVYNIIKEYNVSLPAGRYHEANPITIDMTTSNVEDFQYIPVKESKGAIVFLKDIADIKLSHLDDEITRVNGRPAVVLGVVKSSDSNPLTISDEVRERLPEFQSILPAHATLSLDFDKTKFIRGSLSAIKWTVIEAIVLVILIVFFFLRNFRSVLVPLFAIPMSLIGVMSLMILFGLSINTITLLAMVLAVGLVVDDAIVVLENIHRHIEEGMKPFEAALKGGREIGFAIIAMTFTLAAVYAPVAFIQDTIGQIFFEFAITLAGAVVISGIVALTFTPLMCSKLLRSHEKQYFPQVDIWLDKLESLYKKGLVTVISYPKTVLAVFVGAFLACISLFAVIPQALTPTEDRGVIGVFVPRLAGTTVDEFSVYAKKVEDVMRGVSDAEIYLMFVRDNNAMIVSALKPWDQRKKSAAQWVDIIRKEVEKIPSIQAHPWSWDSGLPGIEQVSARGSGISFYLKTSGSYKELNKYADQVRDAIQKKAGFSKVYHNISLDRPSFKTVIDRHRLSLAGVMPQQVALTLSVMLDRNTGLEFKKEGIRYDVALLNKDKSYFLEEVYTLSPENKIVPLSSFMRLEKDVSPASLEHYNQLRSAAINASLDKGVKLSEGMKVFEQTADEILPKNIQYEFSGAAKKLQESSSMMLLLIAVALLFIFCILAVQFESFIDPFIIMFTVPLAGLGALLLVWLTGGALDIYTQVGLITLIGLISKHGILIVEFANQQQQAGLKMQEAIIEAARLRLRPILMTTGAMVFGAIPLVFALGAGAEARYAIGLVLVGGLTIGTLLTLFVLPSIYLQVKRYLS